MLECGPIHVAVMRDMKRASMVKSRALVLPFSACLQRVCCGASSQRTWVFFRSSPAAERRSTLQEHNHMRMESAVKPKRTSGICASPRQWIHASRQAGCSPPQRVGVGGASQNRNGSLLCVGCVVHEHGGNIRDKLVEEVPKVAREHVKPRDIGSLLGWIGVGISEAVVIPVGAYGAAAGWLQLAC